jgi:hypothetical protein
MKPYTRPGIHTEHKIRVYYKIKYVLAYIVIYTRVKRRPDKETQTSIGSLVFVVGRKHSRKAFLHHFFLLLEVVLCHTIDWQKRISSFLWQNKNKTASNGLTVINL